MAAPGAPPLSARVPQGLCQGPGAAFAAMSAHGDLLGAWGGAPGSKLCPGFFSGAVFPLKSYVFETLPL